MTREGRFKYFGSVDPVEALSQKIKKIWQIYKTHVKTSFEVDSVGINNLTYPVVNGDFQSVGNFELATSLEKMKKAST